MTTEDALFATIDGLIGVLAESGSVSRYITDEKLSAALDAAKNANPERFEKEVAIYL